MKMTLDELIKQARTLKKDGMPGDTPVLVQLTNTYTENDERDHQTTNYLEPITVRIGERTGPKNRTDIRGALAVDGRGRPTGTVRAVRLI